VCGRQLTGLSQGSFSDASSRSASSWTRAGALERADMCSRREREMRAQRRTASPAPWWSRRGTTCCPQQSRA